jgi:D-beta-D-heptose 7-phosphate kinase/D-beta-D-heptose 1-phosphate adenosyltransferase
MERLATERAEQLLAGARSVRCLVVGDLMLDRYVIGSVERISPEAPVPVVRVESESSAVGGAANVAHNAVALGAACAVVGLAGNDAGGVLLERELEALGIDTAGLVTTDDRPTTMKTRVMARRHQIARFDHESDEDADGETADALVRAVRKGAEQADVLVIEDYNKGTLVPTVVAAVMEAGRKRGLPIVVDPKRRRFFGFGGATLFKPNARELADALGEPIRPDDPAWMENVRGRIGADHLLLTLGEQGMALRSADGEYVRVPAVARSVYDVSGAGDTVTAVLALMLGAGASVVEAAILANHAAALEVAKAGVATVSTEEILDHYRAFQALGDAAASPAHRRPR